MTPASTRTRDKRTEARQTAEVLCTPAMARDHTQSRELAMTPPLAPRRPADGQQRVAFQSVQRLNTHSVHDVHTVCSQARTDVNTVLVAQVMMVELYLLVRLKESIFRSAMSHRCWSFPHLLTSSPPQHAVFSGPRDLQENTVHRQPLPQEPLQSLPEQLPHEPWDCRKPAHEHSHRL